MAITKILHMSADFQNVIDSHLNHAIDYILQPKKLGEAGLSAGINCLPDGAFEQMMETKKLFQKTGGRQGYHFILSLRPGEGTPQEMYEIAMEFAERAFYNEYEVVVAKYRFGYKAARYYKDIQIMHKLHAEYLFLCEHNISSFDDLWDFYDRAEKEIERIEAEQKRIYRENSSAKRKCRTEDDVRDYQIMHVNNAIKLDSLKAERRKWTGDQRIVERYMNRALNESLERIAREKEYFDPEIDDTKADVPEYPYSKARLEAERKEKDRQLQKQIEEQKRQEERERRDAYYDWCRRKHHAFMQACDLPMDMKWRSEYMDYLLDEGRIAENDYTKEQLLAPIISFEEFVVEKERETVVGRNDAAESEKSEIKRTDLIDNEAEILFGKLGETQENVIADNSEMFAVRSDEESYEDSKGVHVKETEWMVAEQTEALQYIQEMTEENLQKGKLEKENDETIREVYEKMTDKEKAEWIGISSDDLTGSIKRFQQKMDELGIYFEYGGDRTDAFLKLENAVSNEALPKYRGRFRSSFSR